MITDYILHRYSSDTDSTLGALFKVEDGKPRFRVYTLEDEHREVKVPGETRIPAGRYEIKLRTEGGMHEQYKTIYPWHRGMLHLQDVPNFTWIYIHPGNVDDHTAGCILVGDGSWQNITRAGALQHSGAAYMRLYQEMLEDLLGGHQVFLEIGDYA